MEPAFNLSYPVRSYTGAKRRWSPQRIRMLDLMWAPSPEHLQADRATKPALIQSTRDLGKVDALIVGAGYTRPFRHSDRYRQDPGLSSNLLRKLRIRTIHRPRLTISDISKMMCDRRIAALTSPQRATDGTTQDEAGLAAQTIRVLHDTANAHSCEHCATSLPCRVRPAAFG
jgi:hypothetical protein